MIEFFKSNSLQSSIGGLLEQDSLEQNERDWLSKLPSRIHKNESGYLEDGSVHRPVEGDPLCGANFERPVEIQSMGPLAEVWHHRTLNTKEELEAVLHSLAARLGNWNSSRGPSVYKDKPRPRSG